MPARFCPFCIVYYAWFLFDKKLNKHTHTHHVFKEISILKLPILECHRAYTDRRFMYKITRGFLLYLFKIYFRISILNLTLFYDIIFTNKIFLNLALHANSFFYRSLNISIHNRLAFCYIFLKIAYVFVKLYK